MKKEAQEHGEYVRRVQGETQRYAQTLLAENEHLRRRLAAVESERAALAGKASQLEAVLARNETLQEESGWLAAEQRRLRGQVADLRQQIERHETARRDLESRLKLVEDENQRFSQEYLAVEQQNSNLANLYVASYQLHGTLDRRVVLATIQEIVANLVGSEEMALFELDSMGSTLSLIASFGIAAGPFQRVLVGQGLIGRAVRKGTIHVVERDGREGASSEEAHLSACIPLKLDGRVTGALALFRLLPHKGGFQPLDNELFDLLATQAAVALYCTSLTAGATASLATAP
jgi:GAF domain